MSKTIIVWFRNDLRVRDNEALYQATQDADYIIPIYCFDTRHFKQTQRYGFPKTGKFRTQFLMESVKDLRYSLKDIGANLIVRTGKPEAVIYSLAKYYDVDAVYCHEEVCSEEEAIEIKLDRNLETVNIPLSFFWGSTLYNFDDLPMDIDALPDIFTEFRKSVEKKAHVRDPFPIPKVQLPPDLDIDTGKIPTYNELGLDFEELEKPLFKGGETAALQRIKHYFWKTDQLKVYKETRNGLLGLDYSSKFSPYLALGCISPRSIYEDVKKYEKERTKNSSTYWLIFELIWRDYFRFVSVKYQNDIFKTKGIRKLDIWSRENPVFFEKWSKGETGIPFIDANMRELNATGFMSNRGRQNVASFLVKDLKLPWLVGAEYFESLLLDYDPCSNYGNWNYVAGIGNDPRENRYFNILSQAKRYDPDGDFVKHWIPALKNVPSSRIHEPYLLNETEQKYVQMHLGKHYPKPCLDIHKWQSRKKPKRR